MKPFEHRWPQDKQLFNKLLLLILFAFSYFKYSSLGLCSEVKYSYDSLSRLTNVDYGNGSVISYSYDAAGNRLAYSGVVANGTVAPSITITGPTTGSIYTNAGATINLSGTASDNTGVTLVTWQNLSGGIGVASGTNSWSINGIPLKSGANDVFVTAYDAAGNSAYAVLVVIFPGGGIATTNILFAESGSGGSIDPTRWTTSGNTVVESGGMMQVLQAVTDQGGILTSVPIPINAHGDITITRSAFLHYANQQFAANMDLQFGGLGVSGVRYANYIWFDNGAYGWEDRYGFYLSRDGVGFINQSSDPNLDGPFTPIWDTWFTEKMVYSPDTGDFQYFTNDVEVAEFNIGVMPATNNPALIMDFTAWGWYTGHEQLFSNLLVTQVIPVPPSPPQLNCIGMDNSGRFLFSLNGPGGGNYVIQVSSNLLDWSNLGTNIIPAGGTRIFDFPVQTTDREGFYRALPVP